MIETFADLHLLSTLQATLDERKLTTPTEIQKRAIPMLLNDVSLVGVSETGSGKTLAYVLPILHSLKALEMARKGVKAEAAPRALVLVPTRELGEQVSKVFKPFTHTTRLRVRTVLGGTSFDVSRRSCAGDFEILVATPGRLIQMLDRKLLSLEDVRTLILDEADQVLDEGFLPDVKRIVGACPEDRQMALFSATVTTAVQGLIQDLFKDAKVIRSKGSHRVVPTLTTRQRSITDESRYENLVSLLEKPVEGATVVFVNTREQCDRLAADLKKSGLAHVVYRGEMDKVDRRRNLKTFRDGEVNVLVSTDLASRGIDVEQIARVINYHMPKHMENYLHRVGRTARAGRAGLVINFITERDMQMAEQLMAVDPLAERPRPAPRAKIATAAVPKDRPFKKSSKNSPTSAVRSSARATSVAAKPGRTAPVSKGEVGRPTSRATTVASKTNARPQSASSSAPSRSTKSGASKRFSSARSAPKSGASARRPR